MFSIEQPFSDKLTFINHFKTFYIDQVLKVEKFSTKYFAQAKHIDELSKENEELQKYQSLYINSKTTLNNLINSYSSLSKSEHNIELTRVVSYVDFDDFTKVWLDTPKESEQIQGLISEEYAAGIVVKRADKSLALLNGNSKCNYTVFIGDSKAPGIVHGYQRKNYLKVKYIPVWMDIKVGDEVITSGMDNIFFEGLKVGKVVAIKKMPDMQEATIAPYANVIKEKFFHIYTHKLLPNEQKREEEAPKNQEEPKEKKPKA